MDFRAWLIAQGKDIYMAALENPDSLTRVEQYGDCEFELLNYVGDYAYQELTGRSAYVDCTPEMEKRVLEENIRGNQISSADRVSIAAAGCGCGIS